MGSVLSYIDCYSFFAISKSSVQLDYTHTLSRLIWSSQHIWHSIALAFSFDRLFMFDNGEKIFIASAVNLSCSSIYLLNLFHFQTNYFHFERTTFLRIAIGSQFCSLNEFPFSRCFICVDVVVIFIYSKTKLFEKQRLRHISAIIAMMNAHLITHFVFVISKQRKNQHFIWQSWSISKLKFQHNWGVCVRLQSYAVIFGCGKCWLSWVWNHSYSNGVRKFRLDRFHSVDTRNYSYIICMMM